MSAWSVLASCAVNWLGAGLALLLMGAASNASAAALPPRIGGLSMDDAFKLESFGTVVPLNDGTVVYEQLPPYGQRVSYAFELGSDNAASRLMILEPGSGTPKLLFEPQPHEGYMIASSSPRGSRVAIHVHAAALTSGAIAEVVTGRLVRLEYAPYADYWDASITWLSEQEVLYSVAPPNYPTQIAGPRSAVARRYAEEWTAAFTNSRTTADVLRSRPDADLPELIPGQLIRADAATGKGRIVADGLFLNFRLSPSRRYVAALQRAGVFDTNHAPPTVLLSAYHNDELRVLDLENPPAARMLVPCKACDVLPESISWDSTSDTLIYFARPLKTAWSEGRYYRYDPMRDRSMPLEIADLTFAVDLGSDPKPSKALLLAGKVVALKEAVLMHTRNFAILLSDGDIWSVNRNGRKNLTAKWPAITIAYPSSPFVASGQAQHVIVGYSQEGRRMLAALDVGSGKVVHATEIAAGDEVKGVSSSGTVAVLSRSDRSGIVLTRVHNGVASKFAQVNSFVAQARWPKRYPISYTVDGQQLHACVWTFKTSEDPAPPIVADLYPGYEWNDKRLSECRSDEHGDGGPDSLTLLGAPDHYNPEFLASLGYTVVSPSTPWKLLHTPDEALSGYAKLVDAAVLATQAAGLGDATKVGVSGLSQGGYSVLKVIAQNPSYAAAIAMFSNADFASEWGTIGSTRAILASQIFAPGRSMWFVLGDIQAKAAPWEDPAWFVRSSPYFNASKIETPLLMLQSDLDTNFQMSQFDEMFTALYSTKKTVDYVRYWGEGHGLHSPANIRDAAERIQAWLTQYLGLGLAGSR